MEMQMSGLHELMELIGAATSKLKLGNYILLLIAGVVLVFAGVHWRTMPRRESLHVPLAIIGGLVLGVYLFILREEHATRCFVDWLRSHAAEIEAGGADYQGQSITLDTQRQWFIGCFSCGVTTVRFASRPLCRRTRRGFMYMSGLTLLSVTTGWWGIPWGPIFTIQTLGWNLSGGHVVPMRDMLEELRQEALIAKFEL